MPDSDTADETEAEEQSFVTIPQEEYDALSEGSVQVHEGASITGKIKRGTDTRNQDELHIKGKGATADKAAQAFEHSLSQAEQGDWAQRLRAMQPVEVEEQVPEGYEVVTGIIPEEQAEQVAQGGLAEFSVAPSMEESD